MLFLVCLGIAGSIAAGAHYATVDLTEQNALPAMENSNKLSKCAICTSNCQFVPDKFKCLSECDLICQGIEAQCAGGRQPFVTI
ncbi:MAG: hypothetical protein CW742_10155 [Methanoregula sp.]|nr:MAG: hypothetical protein CW742_10155 [Methanoregula sp.]